MDYNFFQSSGQAPKSEFSGDDITKFKDLVSKWIDPERAKRLILSAKTAPAQEQGFVSGALEKTGEAFNRGISRIGEAWEGIVNDKYTIPEGLVRWVAGTFESALSPFSGAIGQSVESFIPDSTKQAVGSFVAPAVQAGKEFYASQSPEQQRNLANIGVGLEVGANFLWAGWVSKVAGSELAKTAVKETGNVIAKWGQAVGKWIVTGAKATGEAVAGVPKYGISVATGLSKDAQNAIIANPKLYKSVRSGDVTTDTIFGEAKTALDTRISDLSELGRSYKDLRTGKVVANTDDLGNAFANATKNVDTIDLPITDRNAIAEAKRYIDELQGDVTDKQLLAMRKKIDSTISWDKGVSSEGQAVVRSIRSSIDDLAKSRIVGLAERDAKFAPEIQFLNTVKNTIYDAKGNIKDNAISSINNLTGKGKEFKLERFEKILPGITDKIKALKAFEEVQGISGIKTGSIARQGGGILAGTTAGWPIGAAIWFILTHPGVAARVLESYGMAKEAIADLLAKKASSAVKKQATQIIKTAKLPEVEKIIAQRPKSTSLIKPTQAKTTWLKSALELTKSNKGFINPTAIVEDLGLKAKDSTNALMEEARKYGSAEEFVNNKINFQHWWRVTIDEFGITKEMKTAREKFNKLQSERDKIVENSPYWKIDSKFKKRFDEIDKQLEQLDYDKRGRNIKEKWFYFTNDKEYLKTFNKWAVTDAFVDLKNPYIVKKWEIDLIEEAWYNEKTINKLEDQWYDGLIYNNGEQLLAFDKSSIKTKKQLTDIYNQSKALITK